jgi:two-component system, OmpR family, sensor kinase
VRIATRLTLLFVSVTLVVAVAVGWLALAVANNARYQSLYAQINAVVDSGLRNPNTALNNALYVIQHNNYDLTLDVVYATGKVSQVTTAAVPLARAPSVGDVTASRDQVVSVGDLPGFAIRSLDIGGGDSLVVAGSTRALASQAEHQFEVVVAGAIAIALVAGVLARVVMRRDLRSMAQLIDYAGDVAEGAEVGEVPQGAASRDLRDLRDSLAVMVRALAERIEVEARGAKVMQEFIDDASHELRTPLTVVKGYTELLAQGGQSDEQRRRATERMTREIARMESLVRDLLLVAQLREAPQHPDEVVDLSGIVRARADEFALEHPARRVESAVDEGVVVSTRADYVERLLSNALTNVERHTPPDAPVRVTLRAIDGHARLEVDDGGPGLPVYGERPRRFMRYDESRSRETGGSGLGMSIMADITEAMGGQFVTARSDLGGLRVSVSVPVTRN